MPIALTICGHRELAGLADKFRPTHIVSVVDPDATPAEIALPAALAQLPRHVVPVWDDLSGPDDPDAPPAAELTRLLDWTAALRASARLIVHCSQGISRSPAIAYGILRGDMSHAEAVQIISTVRPQATPSPALLALWTRFYDR